MSRKTKIISFQNTALSPLSAKEKLGLLSLEPRLLLDAAGFITGAEVAADMLGQEDAAIATEEIFSGEAARHEWLDQYSGLFAAERGQPESQNGLDINALSLLPAQAGNTEKTSPFRAALGSLSHSWRDAPIGVGGIGEASQPLDLTPLYKANSGFLPLADMIDPAADILGALEAVPSQETLQNTLVFVDASVAGYQSLIGGLPKGVEAIIIKADENGVERMADILAQRGDIEAVHILSHGGPGEFSLGTAVVTESSMTGEYAKAFAVIRDSLSKDADMLIYGCDFGADEGAVAALALASGADIAASNNDTGAAAVGGDWDLEVVSGDIDTKALTLTAFAGVLADTDKDGVDDSVDIDDDNDGILDVDEGVSAIDGFTIGTVILIENGDGSGSFLIPVLDSLGQEVGALTLNYSGFTGDGSTGGSNGTNPATFFTPVLNVGQIGSDIALQLIYSVPDVNQHNFAYSVTSNGLDFTGAEHNLQGQALQGGGAPGRVESGLFTIDHTLSSDPVSLSAGNGVHTIDGTSVSEGQALEDGDSILRNSGRNANRQFNIGFDLGDGETYGVDVLHNNGRLEGIEVTTFVLGASVFAVVGTDFDGDGIENHLDIDSDNDGITDNIEAQTTSGYIAPNADDAATYLANNGLNSAYVLANGITPVNTDSADNPDYLDTNSDNEGSNDTAEAGLGAGPAMGLSDASTDVDGDGLFDIFDAQGGTQADDDFNPNENMNAGAAALPDTDNDASEGVALTADVDFRDSAANQPVAADDEGPIVVTGAVPVMIDVLDGDNDPENDTLVVTGIVDPLDTATVIAIHVGAPVTLSSGTQIELLSDQTLRVTTTALATGSETFDYVVDDNRGGADQGTVTLSRMQGDLITTPPSVSGIEDTAIPLNIVIDPAIISGGALPDIVGTDIGFRDAYAGADPITFVIPPNATAIRITGAGGFDTGAVSGTQEELQTSSIIVDLASATYSGHIFQSRADGGATIDNYTFTDIPLGSPSDSNISGNPLAVLTLDVSGNILSLVDAQAIADQGYLVEFLSADGTSINLLGSSGSVQEPGTTLSTVEIAPDANLVVVSIQSGRDGTFEHEDNAIARIVIDLDTGLASGIVSTQIGRGGSQNTAFGFTDYDITSGQSVETNATIDGDVIGNIPLDLTLSLDANGDLVVERSTPFATSFDTLINVQSFERQDVGSAAINLGTSSAEVNYVGAPNVETTFGLDVPEGAQTANISLAFGNIVSSGNSFNENRGRATVTVDFETETVSGSIIITRADRPDLVTFIDVPFGTPLFDANGPATGVTSNHAAIANFTDQLAATLTFDLVTAQDGSQTLQVSAQPTTGQLVGSHANYRIVSQAQFSGRLPVTISGFADGGTFNAGAINADGNLEVNAEDLAGLTFTPAENYSGQTQTLLVGYNGNSSQILVDVIREADAPTLVTTDFNGAVGEEIAIDSAVVANLVDQDGSETLTVELLNIPAGHSLTDGINSFTAAAGNRSVDITNWDISALSYTPETGALGEYVIDVRATSSDVDGFSPSADTAETLGSFTITINADTDGDGVTDINDIDDDNDGILDRDEGYVTLESLGLSTTESTLSFISTNANIVDPRSDFNDVLRIVDGNQSNASGLVFNGTLEPGSETVFTLGLNVVEGDVIDTFELRASVRALNDFDVRAFDLNIIDASGLLVFSASIDDTGPTATAPASVSGFSLSEGFYTVEFIPQTHGAGNAVTSRPDLIAAEIAELSFVGVTNTGMQIQAPGERDTDMDGIADHLDIDSDNDGIPDNIEAQRTADYVAPNADDTVTLESNNGLNSAYASLNGITPVNSDGDENPDFTDTDSDNDGRNDALEAGHSGGIAAGLSGQSNDADGDGLFDVFETALDGAADDGFNPNEGLSPLDGTLPDAGGDATVGSAVPLVNDLDFRDPNDNPTANPDGPIAITGGAAITVNVVSGTAMGEAADSDPEMDRLVISQIIDPEDSANPIAITSAGQAVVLTSGTRVIVNGDGTLTVTTPVPATGTESFSYEITDGNGGTDRAVVTLSRSSGNTAPIAVDDAFSGGENTPADINLFAANPLTADSDAQDDAFMITRVVSGGDAAALADVADGTGVALSVDGSGGGVFTVRADGTANFDPNREFDDLADGESRLTQIVYQIDDGQGGVDTAVVSYTVTGQNDAIAPQIPGAISVPPDRTDFLPAQNGIDNVAAATFDLADYFSDPDTSNSIGFSLDPADLPAGLTLLGSVISGTFDASASQGGSGGTYNVPITVTDNAGDSFVTTLTYTVSNAAPIARDDAFSINEEGSIFVNVITNMDGTDIDSDGDSLSIDAAALPNGDAIALGEDILLAEGTLRVERNGLVIFNPVENYNGDFVFGYTLTDNEGGTDAASVTITVNPVNDAPAPRVPGDMNPPSDPFNYIPVQTVSDSANIPPFDLTPYFTDVDGDSLTLLIEPADLPEGLSFDGTQISGRVAANASQGGVDGVYTIPIMVIDNNGGSFTTNITYTVINPAPIVDNAIGAQSAQDGETVSYLPQVSDPDGDRLTFSATGLPVGLVIDAGTGEISGTIDNSASQSHGGVYNIVVTADDSEGGRITDSFDLTVTNPAPLAADDAFEAPEDGGISGNVITNSDVDPDGDIVFIIEVAGAADNIGQAVPGSTGGLFTVDEDGSLRFDANGDYENLDVGETVTSTLNYVLSDGEGGLSAAMVTVTVQGANDGPIVTGTITAQSGEDSTAQLPFDASRIFSDIDVELLTFSADDLPAWMEIDPATGVITGTPPANASQGGDNADGVYQVTINASDGDASTRAQITYRFTNPAPVVDIAIGEHSALDGEDVIIQPAISDPDGDNLTYAATGLPEGLIIDAASGEISGAIDNSASQNHGGVYDIVITADDGEGGRVADNFTLTVTNPSPIAADRSFTLEEDSALSFNLLTENNTDPDGDEIFIETVVLPGGMRALPGDISEITGGVLTVNMDGSAEFTPSPNYSGIVTFGYILSDGEGGRDSAQVSLTVTPVNDAPIPIDPHQPMGSGEANSGPVDPENYIPVQVASDGTAVSNLDLTRYFEDPDLGDILSIEVELSELPPGLEFDPVAGVVFGTPSSSASQGGDPSAPGTYRVAVSARDSRGERFTTYLTYEISNIAPSAVNDGPIDVMEDDDVTIDLLGNDRSPDGDSLIITQINGIAVVPGEPLILPSGSAVTVLTDGTLRYQPAENLNGRESLSYLVSDGEGGTDQAHVEIQVAAENDQPSLVSLGGGAEGSEGENSVSGEGGSSAVLLPQSHVDGQHIEAVDISAGFRDADGDQLRFTAEGLPPGLRLNAQTGLIDGTLLSDASEGGPYEVTITATDPSGASVSTGFVWTVDNLPPVVEPISILPMTAGQPVHIDVGDSVVDPDGDGDLRYAALGLPAGLSINARTGVISGVPTTPLATADIVTISVDDGQGGVTSFELSLLITEEPALDQNFSAPGSGWGTGSDEGNSLSSRNLEGFGDDRLGDDLSSFNGLEQSNVSSELQRYFKEQVAAHRDYLGRARGEAGFKGGIGLSPIAGYGNGYLIVEALSYEHNVNVQLSSTLDAFEGIQVQSWQVTLANGDPLPRWAEHLSGSDFMQITRPLDQEVIELRIRALLENGQTATTITQIDLGTGGVTQQSEAISAAQSLQDQLALETQRLEAGSRELLKALAS